MRHVREAAGGIMPALVAAITEAIVTGRLAPGQRLVEADLQAQFGAGRSSVREALQQLQAQGLVTLEPNRGASVRRLTRKEVVDLFTVRERVEGLAAGLAAAGVRDAAVPAAERKALAARLTRMRAVAEAGRALEYGQLNRALHADILAMARNPELDRVVQQLSLPIFQQQFRGFLEPANQRSSHAQHEAIVGAILAGDVRRADACMRRHVREGLRMVMRWPDENFAA